MTTSINISGYIVGEPNFVTFESGSQKLSVLVSARNGDRKREGEEYAPTNLYNIELWGNYATAMQPYLLAGTQVFVSGRHVVESWNDPEGNKHQKNVIKDPNIDLGKAKDSSSETKKSASSSSTKTKNIHPTPVVDADYDDIPF